MKFIKTFEDRYSDIFTNINNNIFEACRNGVLELVKKFIEVDKIDVNKPNNNSNTPLIIASDTNRIDVVEYLIGKNANINYQDKFGRTALHYASMRSNISIVKILIKSDANWNLMDYFNADFLHYLNSYKNRIITEYPEQYQKYLMIKKAEKFNIRKNIKNLLMKCISLNHQILTIYLIILNLLLILEIQQKKKKNYFL